MFGIPGKQAVSITPKAAGQIARLMAASDTKGLRIGLKKGGCAGMEYTMDYVAEALASSDGQPCSLIRQRCILDAYAMRLH